MAIGIVEKPTAICGFVSRGLPVCKAGWNGKCHSITVCTEQMRLDNPSVRTPEAQALYDVECMAVDPETAYCEYLKRIKGGDANGER